MKIGWDGRHEEPHQREQSEERHGASGDEQQRKIFEDQHFIIISDFG